jgi:hypothetical protein
MSSVDVTKPDPSATHNPPGMLTETARELDRRHSDGIDVRLLWQPHTDRVSIALEDERLGHSLEFEVAGEDALDAFNHPYIYTSTPRSNQAWQSLGGAA